MSKRRCMKCTGVSDMELAPTSLRYPAAKNAPLERFLYAASNPSRYKHNTECPKGHSVLWLRN